MGRRIDPEKDTAMKHVEFVRNYTGARERRDGQMKITNLAQEVNIETPSGSVTVKAALDEKGNAYLNLVVNL